MADYNKSPRECQTTDGSQGIVKSVKGMGPDVWRKHSREHTSTPSNIHVVHVPSNTTKGGVEGR